MMISSYPLRRIQTHAEIQKDRDADTVKETVISFPSSTKTAQLYLKPMIDAYREKKKIHHS
jgi:hypothetical protein